MEHYNCHKFAVIHDAYGFQVFVVLCIQGRTSVWPMQKHWSLHVQMGKKQDHSHLKEFEHYHVQPQEYSSPSYILESIMQCRKILVRLLEYFHLFFFGLKPFK